MGVKTSTAIAGHMTLGAAQMGVMAASPAIPWWGQLLIQVGLMVGQIALSWANSNSDQKGNPLPGPPS